MDNQILKKLSLKLFFIIIPLLFLVSLILITLHFFEPWAIPADLTVTNLTDAQASVSWLTDKPTRTAVLISEDNKFPLVPIFPFEQGTSVKVSPVRKFFKDDGEKYSNKLGFYQTHQVTIGGLIPEKRYYFRIYQGWRHLYQGSFKTGPVLSSVNTPNPVYGRVLKPDKTPAVGALVYLFVVREASSAAVQTGKSAAISTLTNKEGRWSLDLGNLRSRDLKRAYQAVGQTTEHLTIVTGFKTRSAAGTVLGKDKPWPDLTVK